MKKIIAFAIIVLLTGLIAATPAARCEDAGIQANMEDISLPDFIKFIGKYTGRNIVYMPNQIPRQNLTIFSNQAMSEPELMAVFQKVLNAVHLDAVARGDVLYILPKKDIKDLDEMVKPSGSKGLEQEMITTVYRLQPDMDSKDTAKMLHQLSSATGFVTPIPSANCVLIRDQRSRIQKMIDLLKMVQGFQTAYQTEVIELENAKAESAAKKINEFYTQMNKQGRLGNPPMVTAIDWTNSILVAGTVEQIKAIRGLITKIDNLDRSAFSLKVYKLQNAEAGSAATVLNTLIKGTSEELNKDKKAPAKQAFQVAADTTTNSILVMGDPDFLSQVDEIISKMDQPLDQVYIEALILETSFDNSQKFGVEWFAGGASGDKSIGSVGFLSQDSSLLKYASPVINGGGPDLSAMGNGLSVGVLGNIVSFNGQDFPTLGMMAKFLRGVSDFNLLSVPQIMTLDNSEAEIFVGQSRPFQTGQKSSDSSDTSVISTYEYKDVGISLIVTPHVNKENGLIRMEIQQSYDQVVSQSQLDVDLPPELPVTLNRKTRTSVQMIDGSTMVISGIIENSENRSQTGVPFLSQIPILGWFFKERTISGKKNTLMIFISSRVIKTQEQLEALSMEKHSKLKKQREERQKVIEDEFFGGRHDEDDFFTEGKEKKDPELIPQPN